MQSQSPAPHPEQFQEPVELLGTSVLHEQATFVSYSVATASPHSPGPWKNISSWGGIFCKDLTAVPEEWTSLHDGLTKLCLRFRKWLCPSGLSQPSLTVMSISVMITYLPAQDDQGCLGQRRLVSNYMCRSGCHASWFLLKQAKPGHSRSQRPGKNKVLPE